MPEPNISTCQDVGMRGKFLSVDGEFAVQQVVELLWARLLVVLYKMSVAGKMLYNKFSRLRTCCTTSTTCCELVRWWCPLYNMSIAGVRGVEFGTYGAARCETLRCVYFLPVAGNCAVFTDRRLRTATWLGNSDWRMWRHLIRPLPHTAYTDIYYAQICRSCMLWARWQKPSTYECSTGWSLELTRPSTPKTRSSTSSVCSTLQALRSLRFVALTCLRVWTFIGTTQMLTSSEY